MSVTYTRVTGTYIDASDRPVGDGLTVLSRPNGPIVKPGEVVTLRQRGSLTSTNAAGVLNAEVWAS